MNNELLLLIEKHTDTLIEQTKARPQETIVYKMNKRIETFSFSPPLNPSEEGKWLSGVTSFECTNSIFNITNGNNSFSPTIPGFWITKGGHQTIIKLKEILELREQDDIKLHVEVRKRKSYQNRR